MINKRNIFYAMGPATRRLFRRLYFFLTDILEKYLDKVINENGLKVLKKHYGYWSGRRKDNLVDFQDIYILEKQ